MGYTSAWALVKVGFTEPLVAFLEKQVTSRAFCETLMAWSNKPFHCFA